MIHRNRRSIQKTVSILLSLMLVLSQAPTAFASDDDIDVNGEFTQTIENYGNIDETPQTETSEGNGVSDTASMMGSEDTEETVATELQDGGSEVVSAESSNGDAVQDNDASNSDQPAAQTEIDDTSTMNEETAPIVSSDNIEVQTGNDSGTDQLDAVAEGTQGSGDAEVIPVVSSANADVQNDIIQDKSTEPAETDSSFDTDAIETEPVAVSGGDAQDDEYNETEPPTELADYANNGDGDKEKAVHTNDEVQEKENLNLKEKELTPSIARAAGTKSLRQGGAEEILCPKCGQLCKILPMDSYQHGYFCYNVNCDNYDTGLPVVYPETHTLDDNCYCSVCNSSCHVSTFLENGGDFHKDPTCTEPGIDIAGPVWQCDRCHRYLKDAESPADITYAPALGHDLIHHDSQAPTCTAVGWDAYDTCSRCDYSTYVEKPALGHAWKTEWSYDESTHYHACSRCTEKKDVDKHNEALRVMPVLFGNEGYERYLSYEALRRGIY